MSDALLIGDLHLHNWTRFATTLPDGRNSRFAQQQAVLDRIEDIADEIKPQYLIQFGDALHQRGRVTFSVYEPFVQWLSWQVGVGREVILFPGNHDEESVGVTSMGVLKFIEGVTVIDRPFWQVLDGIGAVFVVPYRHGQDVGKVVREAALPRGASGSGLVFTHYGLHGTPLTTEYALESSLTTSDVTEHFERGVAGHVHAPGHVGSHFLDLGAVMHYDFGDRGPRYVWHMTGSPSTGFKFEPIEIPAPQFVTATYPRISAPPEHGGFLRVLGVPAAQFDEIAKHAVHDLGWLGCEPVEATMAPEAVAALSSAILVDEGMVTEYVSRVYAAESEAYRAEMITFGLACLRERETA